MSRVPARFKGTNRFCWADQATGSGSLGTGSATASTTSSLFEVLEPRILLSGNGLLGVTSDPLGDVLADGTSQVAQHAALFETGDEIEEQTGATTSSFDATGIEVFQPLFTSAGV